MSEPLDMDAPVTRREMHEALDNWAGAIIEKLSSVIRVAAADARRDLQTTRDEFRGELRATEKRLSDELRQHTKTSEGELATRLVAVDKHYQDLPGRVKRLEAKVFAPKPRRRARRSR